MKIITGMEKENVSICFYDVSKKLKKYGEKLNLRDYYTVSIYFRLFIPDMFPNLKKAIYLDSDMVILDDIYFFKKLEHRFVNTSMKDGLTAKDMERVLELFEVC